jgi:hypothetical protein
MLNKNRKLSISSFPFNYLRIENCFDEELSHSMSNVFDVKVAEGKPIGKVGEEDDLVYSAINYTPQLADLLYTSIGSIASVQLKNFIGSVFGVSLDENLMIGMHRHNPPSKAGWSHSDFAVVSFPNIPCNFSSHRVFTQDYSVNYADDSALLQPDTLKTARSIACLYYTASNHWSAGKGGETGLFLPNRETLAVKVPPRGNSLLAFEISPLSYHAYLGSASMERNCFIWWYHSPIPYITERYAESIAEKNRMGMDPWDRWTGREVEKYVPPLAENQ